MLGRTKGGLNSKLHAVCDGRGRPVVMMLSEGQMNDQKGAGILAPMLPPARELIADRGYDSNPFRAALAERGITACIPSKKNRKQPIPQVSKPICACWSNAAKRHWRASASLLSSSGRRVAVPAGGA